jgi:dolichol-phosphate mannosyltransferase
MQSRILNWMVPKALSIPITDITNGLRRYSRAAVTQLLLHHPVSTSFIFLAEQALLVDRGGFRISEVPIVFAERRAGESSVTFNELRDSVGGLRKILSLRKKIKKS